ncbi:class I SAM-dependent methyltransferase [Acidovorax temperans]|uniref:class I SAM-dependent methyltransferase n=1 Tax=Acidovorax temperans TaxID=80878 RepID=UPI0035B05596
MNSHISTVFWGASDHAQFIAGVQHCIDHLASHAGIYTGDNLFTFQKNLSFLEDEPLMNAWRKHATDAVEQAILWRTSVLLGGVRNGLKLGGDFVEGGCYKGTSVRILCDAVDFGSSNKRWFLYDLFEHDPSTMSHHAMPEHGTQLYRSVLERFADVPNIIVKQGRIPEVLMESAPEKIAFMHLDMNNAEAEVGALEVLWERMVPGAMLVLDDYGWLAYRAQKLAEDAWLQVRGFHVIELPTGQGLVIKQ